MIRAAVAISAAAWCLAAAIVFTGGISLPLGGVRLSAHSPVVSLIVAIAFTLVVALARKEPRRAALAWWWEAIERRGTLAAAVLAAAAVAIGIHWGTFVAGGSDSYCYLNQAELFARGQVHDFEALGADPAWPGRPGAFIPAGHSPVPSRPGAMAPICPAGYPMLLAAAELAVGRQAMFWVTPLMGGLLVWLTFLLGRTLSGGAAGLLASVLVVSSPIFIYQVVQPMNDVPAAALWCAVLVVACREDANPGRRALLCGLLSGAALTVRPNLLPLAAVIGLWTLLRPVTRDPLAGIRYSVSGTRYPVLGTRNFIRSAVIFTAALLPGIGVVLAAQWAMYGSPLRSGYGDLSSLFAASHVLPNLARYPRWVLAAHTPIILLALAAPLFLAGTARRTAGWVLLFIVTVFACYLPYVVFDDWWYQRFVLPAIAPLLALTAVSAVSAIRRLEIGWRTVTFAALCALVAFAYLDRGVRWGAFRLQEYEHRFRAAGDYITRLPDNAAFITVHQSGSVRFYSGRTTVLWEEIPPGKLGEAVAYLRAQHRKPYFLLEGWEESNFRSRFPNDALGSLAWPPSADIDRVVRIYDPDDYPKYMRGEQIPTDRVVTRR